VSVSTGLRPGEVCGLTEKDIDFENEMINVNKTLLYQKLEGDTKKTFHYDPPKTKSSKRMVPMNKKCVLAMKKQMMQRNVIMAKQCAKPVEGFEALLFTTKLATPINAQIYSDSIRKIINEINMCRDELEKMERFSAHCFRHTFTTRCFEAGIEPKTVQKYLGHATLQMTMDLYTHVLQEHSQEEMMKLEKVLDETLDVSEMMIDNRFEKFNRKDEVDNIIYMPEVI
jgi:integrase